MKLQMIWYLNGVKMNNVSRIIIKLAFNFLEMAILLLLLKNITILGIFQFSMKQTAILLLVKSIKFFSMFLIT
jgi:hypothetical protein